MKPIDAFLIKGPHEMTRLAERQRVAKAEGTFRKYEHTIESFLASLGERAKRNINQIASRDIQRFRDAP